MELNYYQTLIAVAEDCPVRESVAPPKKDGRLTAAVVQYEMLSANPYVFTQEEVLFQTWLQRQDLPENLPTEEVNRLRQAFFSKPQACLRSSPLPKRYGWGLLFDQEGRVALCPMESQEYKDILNGKNKEIQILKALRSKRA